MKDGNQQLAKLSIVCNTCQELKAQMLGRDAEGSVSELSTYLINISKAYCKSSVNCDIGLKLGNAMLKQELSV